MGYTKIIGTVVITGLYTIFSSPSNIWTKRICRPH